jgi:riboflavin synthase
VTGHIDGLAEIIAREDLPDMARLAVRAPAALARFVAAKGSVALDGVSLTVNEVAGAAGGTTCFGVNLIPHTCAVTTFGTVAAGERVNLEVDPLARYVARMQEFDAGTPG